MAAPLHVTLSVDVKNMPEMQSVCNTLDAAVKALETIAEASSVIHAQATARSALREIQASIDKVLS